MIEIMTDKQIKVALAAAFALLLLAILLLNPTIANALLFKFSPPANIPQLEAEALADRPAPQVVAPKTETVRTVAAPKPVTQTAKEKRIAEINKEIAALIAELDALLAE